MIPKDTYYIDIFFHYIIRTLYVNIIIILYIYYIIVHVIAKDNTPTGYYRKKLQPGYGKQLC